LLPLTLPTTTVLRCCVLKGEHADGAGDLAAGLAEHLAAAATRVCEAPAAARPRLSGAIATPWGASSRTP
jgi:hypothetical protein